jgi:ATP-dependent helicase/nuclease subunit A
MTESKSAPAIIEATRIQQCAASPTVSAWVMANAGAGKTRVLTERVARLMLAGAEPSRILCLTYTRAAAANMADRLSAMLGRWSTMSDAELCHALEALEGQRPDEQRLKRARELFVSALDAPGGLKIRTIHAFAESVLKRFPFESGLGPDFTVLDDRAAQAMKEAALQKALLDVGQNDPSMLEPLLINKTEKTLKSAMATALTKGALASPESVRRTLSQILALSDNLTTKALEEELMDLIFTDQEITAFTTSLSSSKPKCDIKLRGLLQSLTKAYEEAKPHVFAKIFLNSKGTGCIQLTSITSKEWRDKNPALSDRLEQAYDLFSQNFAQQKKTSLLEQAEGLQTLSISMKQHFELEKSRLKALDYDDLLNHLRDLLYGVDHAWITFKLDSAIDHILVDEAQDTNPIQWAIIHKLVEEFSSGEGAAKAHRTVFAVGDEKQSIYSFQGAEPEGFVHTGAELKERFEKQKFLSEKMRVSFRSVQDILEAVDLTFKEKHRAKGLTALEGEPIIHETGRPGKTGFVELWAPLYQEKSNKTHSWEDALHIQEKTSATVELANHIASKIEGMLSAGERLETTGASIKAGDILILVRSRDGFFKAMVRALKQRQIPVAGADRLKVTQHIAIKDCLSLAQALLTPDDDLSLAEALKSPLLGLSDEDLIMLAPHRKASLWEALEVSPHPHHIYAAQKLHRWRAKAAGSLPHTFLSELLGLEGGRSQFRTHFSNEVSDALDEFLSLALDEENKNSPTLASFIETMRTADVEIKRDLESSSNEVRVMTIHGAKGLEAPIVFVADTKPPLNNRDLGDVFSIPAQKDESVVLMPRPSQEGMPEGLESPTNEALKKLQAEHKRLLYVAMTRAEDRLYLCGITRSKEPSPESWLGMVGEALRSDPRTEVLPQDGPVHEVLRFRANPPKMKEHVPLRKAPQESTSSPEWLNKAPAKEHAPPLLRPSKVMPFRGFQAKKPEHEQDAKTYGTVVHQLVALHGQSKAQAALLSKAAEELPQAALENARSSVAWMQNEQALEPFFGPEARAEVPITGTLKIGSAQYRLTGRIDRLSITPHKAYILDIKTGHLEQKPSQEHILQLALYRAMLEKIYPMKEILCILAYPDSRRVVEVSPQKCMDALRTLDESTLPSLREA